MSATDTEYGVAPGDYRLPAAISLGRVRLQVADLARSLDYYQGVLGMSVQERNGSTARLGAGEDTSPLVELVERPGAKPVPPRGRLGLYHYAILLPDRASLGRLVRHLSRLDVALGASDHLVSEALYLQDPDGLGIEVYADRPRTRWTVRGQELAMDSLPLNVADLLDASGQQEWAGMPAGTIVGHVHLHVDDLERASEFYHQTLGFDAMVWSFPGALFLSAGGYHHHLGLNTWAAGAPVAGSGDARLLDWELHLPENSDVERATESLTRRGHDVERRGPVAYTVGPWGVGLRLVTGD